MLIQTTVLQNARLADGRLTDIEIADGRIVSVHPAGAEIESTTSHDLGGWLLLPALAEPHAHLDKALTSEHVPNPTGDLVGAIDAWTKAADEGLFTYADTLRRATAAMELLLVRGVTAVRTHVNVLEHGGTESLRAVKEAAAGFAGLLDVQTVALTSWPMTGPEGAANRAVLRQAIELGVDFVGGCPHLDPDGPGLIANAIAAATDAGIGIDLHVDELLDPLVLTLKDLASQVMNNGFQGLVAASHCVTLGMQNEVVQREVSRMVAEANISVFPLPQTNLFLQGRDHHTAMPRGLTAVKALQEAGVLVAAGADNVQDPFNLVGRSDPLETASLMVMAGHQLPNTAFDMVSNNVRLAIGLKPITMSPGDLADFLAIDAPSIRGAIAEAPMSRKVFRHGVLVAAATQTSEVFRPESLGQ